MRLSPHGWIYVRAAHDTYRHGGDPLAAGLELVHQRLLDQVVDLHLRLRGHEEVGMGRRRELHALHDALQLGDGDLRVLLRQLVDVHHRLRRGAGVDRHVVASTPQGESLHPLVVPAHVLHGTRVDDGHHVLWRHE